MRRSTIILLSITLLVLITAGYFAINPEAARQILVDLELAVPETNGYTTMGVLEAEITTLAAEHAGRVVGIPLDLDKRDGLGWPVAMEPDGTMWIANQGGVARFDGQTQKDFTRNDGLGGSNVTAIGVAPDGELWFGTEAGVSRFDGETWITYTAEDGLAPGQVLSIAFSPDGTVWIGTDGAGVAYLDGEVWRAYTSDHGLAGDTIYSIAVDHEGAIWFETDNGISRLRDGQWDQFVANEGEEVQQGQVVIRLDTSILALERDAAKARYEATQAQLRLLEAVPRQVDLAVAQANVDQAVAILEGANQALTDARRVTPLRVRDEQVSLAQAGVDQAEAGLEGAQVALEALERGAKQSDLEAARALLQAAQAELERLRNQIEYGESRSPIDGVLLDRLFLPGELALPGWPIALVANISQLRMTVYLPEADLGVARIGDKVQVTVDAYPDRMFSGQIIQIADQAEFTPRTVQTPEDRVILVYAVRILIQNPDGALKPGLPADVTLGAGS